MIALWVGIELTLYGMGLVFLLLAILWGVIALLVRFDSPVAPADTAVGIPVPGVARPVRAAPEDGAIDLDTLAAVVIACRAHRMTRRQQAAPEMRVHEPGSLPSRWLGSGRTSQNRIWARRGRH